MPLLDSIVQPILGAGASLLAARSLPQLDGSLSLSGLSQSVQVYRDSLGIPHIYAQNLPDLFFAQGYIHAQDRLWQMDFYRRVASGRLAEVLGSQGLPVDRWLRILGIARAARLDLEILDSQLLTFLQAYSAGVNARIAQKNFPVEFTLLSYQPDLWSPLDSLTWAKFMAWMQSTNWECELIRAALIERLGSKKAAELELAGETPLPDMHLVLTAGIQALQRAQGAENLAGPTSKDGIGSNNWVISGSRTSTGKPLLASDMHLQLSAPAIWYENHLSGGGLNVTGVSLPGIPFVIAGHNQNLAWAFTDSFADVQDLYVEELRREPDGSLMVLTSTGWQPVQVISEKIAVRRGEPVVEEVVLTQHGPIINPLIQDVPVNQALSLKWSSYQPEKTTQAMYEMNRASTSSEFREALRHWGGPALNLVWADTTGHIGYHLVGNIPLRKPGSGRVPTRGNDLAGEWDGFIPYDRLPASTNPSQGYFATANNRVTDPSYPYDLGDDFSGADRALRIGELIQSIPQLDISAVQRMQYDQLSPSARAVAACLGSVQSADPHLSPILQLFKSWDGTLSPESPEALIYEEFSIRLIPHLLEGHLGELTKNFLGYGPTPAIAEHSLWGFRAWEWLVKVLDDPTSHWYDLGSGEQRDEVLLLVLRETLHDLQSRYGSDISSWSWGKRHTLTFQHPLGQARFLDRYFNRGSIPIGGDGTTVWASFANPRESAGIIGPPFRFIADLSDLDHCQAMLAPGQSGLPASPHYDDQIDAWLEGQYHTMWFSRADVEREALHTLELLPG